MRWAVLGLIAVPAAAEITYEGDEALALRCADMFAAAAIELEDEMTPEERAKTLTLSTYILRDHVSGTWQDKDAAMKEVAARQSTADTIADYRTNRDACLAKFSVNP